MIKDHSHILNVMFFFFIHNEMFIPNINNKFHIFTKADFRFGPFSQGVLK